MTKRQLEVILNVISHSFHCIAAGGCGVFAYILHKELLSIGIKTNIVLFVSHGFDTSNPKNNIPISDWGCIGVSHAMLYHYKWGYIDNYGFFEADSTDNYDNEVTVTAPFLKTIAGQPLGWNGWFNRKQILPMWRLLRKLIHNPEITKHV